MERWTLWGSQGRRRRMMMLLRQEGHLVSVRRNDVACWCRDDQAKCSPGFDWIRYRISHLMTYIVVLLAVVAGGHWWFICMSGYMGPHIEAVHGAIVDSGSFDPFRSLYRNLNLASFCWWTSSVCHTSNNVWSRDRKCQACITDTCEDSDRYPKYNGNWNNSHLLF